MKTKYYKLHLRNIDTKAYRRNPIVIANNDFEQLIGKADILRYKYMVKVTFMDEYYEQFKDETKWTLGCATVSNTAFFDKDGRPNLNPQEKQQLVYLTMIPILPDENN